MTNKNRLHRFLFLIIFGIFFYILSTNPYHPARIIAAISTFYKQRVATLQQGKKYFNNTPGFDHLTQSLATSLDTVQGKGYWFELELALCIQKKFESFCKNGKEKVVAFHYWLEWPAKNLRREIDIVTTKYCIECKNIKWEILTPQQQQQILAKLQEQKLLVSLYNRHKIPIANHRGQKYILWSHNSIPQQVKELLHKLQIEFVEGFPLLDTAAHLAIA